LNGKHCKYSTCLPKGKVTCWGALLHNCVVKSTVINKRQTRTNLVHIPYPLSVTNVGSKPVTTDRHFNSGEIIFIFEIMWKRATWMVHKCHHNNEIHDRPHCLRSDTPRYLSIAKLVTIHPTMLSHTLC